MTKLYSRDINNHKVINYIYQPPEFIDSQHFKINYNCYWSIGILLLEMCFGKVPFEITEYYTISKEKIQILFIAKEYSQDLIDFVCFCLNLKRSKRKVHNEILQHCFFTNDIKSGREYRVKRPRLNSVNIRKYERVIFLDSFIPKTTDFLF